MKIHVSMDCSGHGRCEAVNAALYPLDDDGFSAADGSTVPPGLEDDARRGAQECPSRAITLTED